MSDSVLEKIAAIELEMSRTQKNKATATHLGSLRAKLAKLQRELIDAAGPKGGPKGEGFDVTKTGDCRVGLVGFPSVGKSTLLTKLTGVFSEAAAYEFTTLTCVPGVVSIRRARAARARARDETRARGTTDEDVCLIFTPSRRRLNTEALAFSFSIFPVSSRGRRITRVEGDR